jgi:hyperosmotically inducible periplasmic protein
MNAGISRYAAVILVVALPGVMHWDAYASFSQGASGPTPGAVQHTNTHTSTQTSTQEKSTSPVEREIHHQLLLLPYYSVFDNLEFSLSGSKVILVGQVVRPSLKANAEAAVKSIEGVVTVDNRIEVLPVSAADDDLRTAIYRAVFEDDELKKYGAQTLPTLHILVKNGHVSLAGFVDSEEDKNLAATRTRGVANVGAVRNDLAVHAKQSAEK